MTEQFGFEMLLTSQDIWPEMQGSVLAVKEDLIDNHPEVVRKLVAVAQKATDWINEHPDEAAEVMARQLQVVEGKFPSDIPEGIAYLEITPALLRKSMSRLDYTTDIDPKEVQATIDYIGRLGYIKNSFKALDILDLRFHEGE
jgi:NitT/TauT family transport system substrate-binding protein